MLSITKLFEFEASHKLPYHQGKCKEWHGHSYKLEIEVSGPRRTTRRGDPDISDEGMIMDFSELKELVKTKIIDKMDHTSLNSFFLNPTAEEIINWIVYELRLGLKEKGKIRLVRVRLWETSTSYAEWRDVEILPLNEV
jgi:6-pyruvoyltetrahydropterin/6-carboxytetrahydropterin synthase